MSMDIEKEGFKRRFPNLSVELDDEAADVPIDHAASEETAKTANLATAELSQKKPVGSFDGYDPTAVDFIRRCGSEKEAQEIIDYMERKGEIGRSEAQKMRSQLRSKGLRSFGAKKEYGFYLKSIE